MNLILKMILCITILLIILILILNFISKKTFLDREKCSPFECGFDPKSSSRSPFSLQFFLIAVIFLIFDVEITLLLPMIILMKYTNILNFIMTNMMILLILIMGLIHEWNQGSLNWAI